MMNLRNILVYVLAAAFLGSAVLDVHAQARASRRGAGPFKVTLIDGSETQVRLLSRDKNLVMVMRETSQGTFIETGIDYRKISSFDIPELPIFELVDQVQTSEQVLKLQAELTKLGEQLLPFRDLPGIVADKVLLKRGQLYEKQERWKKALALYVDILNQKYDPPEMEEATMRTGLCLARLGEYERALKYLDLDKLEDDDLSLLSEVYMARAKAFEEKDNIDQALLNYLYLVVFHPFVDDNEQRCLAAVLPLYAKLKDWNAAWQTIQTIKKQYPGTEAERTAEAFMKEHEEMLSAEAAYHEEELDNQEDELEEGDAESPNEDEGEDHEDE